jgi:large subunit ribosomal protein L21
MFAVISFKGKQYKVTEGQTYKVDLIDNAEDKTITFGDVLLITNEKKTVIGTPKVEGATVEADVLGETKADKVFAVKFKAKKRYKRNLGHTQRYTLVKINKIKANEK